MTVAKPRPRRERGAGSVFERTTTTRQGKTITRFVGELELPSYDGKRRRKTVYGTSRQDALERMAKARRDYDRMGNLPTSDPTLNQWCTTWLAAHARRLKPGTLASYRSKIDQWIVPVIGRHRLSRLSPDHVRALHRTMRESGAAPNHVLRVHAVLSAVLTDAVKEERIFRNVAKVAGGPPKAKSNKKALSIAEAFKVLELAAPKRLGTTWLAAMGLGIRQGERLGLRWSHVDLDAGTVDVAWALARAPWAHGCHPKCGLTAGRCPQRRHDIEPTLEQVHLEGNHYLLTPKSARHMVPLPAFLIGPLRTRYAAVLAERSHYTIDHDLVWCTETGAPIRQWDDWQEWFDLVTDAAVTRVSVHEIRHTTVTLLMEAGVDRSVITEIVGHSDALTTEAYKHVSLDAARAALDRLGTALALTASPR